MVGWRRERQEQRKWIWVGLRLGKCQGCASESCGLRWRIARRIAKFSRRVTLNQLRDSSSIKGHIHYRVIRCSRTSRPKILHGCGKDFGSASVFMQVPVWNPIICSKGCRRLEREGWSRILERLFITILQLISGASKERILEKERKANEKHVQTWSAVELEMREGLEKPGRHLVNKHLHMTWTCRPSLQWKYTPRSDKDLVLSHYVVRTHQTSSNLSVAVSEFRRDTPTLHSGILIVRAGQVLRRVWHETVWEYFTVIGQAKLSQDPVDITLRLEQDELAAIILGKPCSAAPNNSLGDLCMLVC